MRGILKYFKFLLVLNSKPVLLITSSNVNSGFIFSILKFLSFLLKLNKALFVIKYLGPPGLYTLGGEIPGAEMKSTFFTNVLGYVLHEIE